ncbi:MAG TPA: PorV/PorQ family protein, partial [Ignavibacteriaceae bacterium]|nr:PorV/PorQ family protein [Ignavibacteriaceae bacterium]
MFSRFRLIVMTIITMSMSMYAQVGINKVAQSTMNFLLVSVSPKASAMGDAYYAVGTGAESIFYNPAAMVETKNTFNIVLDYTQWIADIKYLAGAVSWNLGNYGAVGISMMTVNYGTIYGTSLVPPSLNSQYPLGYIDNGDVPNVGAYAVGISYAKAISNQFMVGGNIKIAGQNLGENRFSNGTFVKNDASKLVFDVGIKYYTGFKNFRFGMTLRNFATDVKRELISEQLPLTFNLGAAIDLMDFITPKHEK